MNTRTFIGDSQRLVCSIQTCTDRIAVVDFTRLQMRGRAQLQLARPSARIPVNTPLCSDGIAAPAACATLSAMTAFHSVHTPGVL